MQPFVGISIFPIVTNCEKLTGRKKENVDVRGDEWFNVQPRGVYVFISIFVYVPWVLVLYMTAHSGSLLLLGTHYWCPFGTEIHELCEQLGRWIPAGMGWQPHIPLGLVLLWIDSEEAKETCRTYLIDLKVRNMFMPAFLPVFTRALLRHPIVNSKT